MLGHVYICKSICLKTVWKIKNQGPGFASRQQEPESKEPHGLGAKCSSRPPLYFSSLIISRGLKIHALTSSTWGPTNKSLIVSNDVHRQTSDSEPLKLCKSLHSSRWFRYPAAKAAKLCRKCKSAETAVLRLLCMHKTRWKKALSHFREWSLQPASTLLCTGFLRAQGWDED